MIALILGAVTAIFLAGIFLKSVKIVVKLLINILVGVIALYFFNLFFENFGLTIIINPITSFLVGFFGLPGVIVLVILKLFL